MSGVRPPIPAPLQRSLMIEAGYRCAICHSTASLEFEHIVEWSKVKAHEFENMIVLCANCHGRKQNSSNPRHINRSSLKQFKQKLMILNGRYSDLEKRIIESFREALETDPDNKEPSLFIPERLSLLVRYLIIDEIVRYIIYQSSVTQKFPDGTILRDDYLHLYLTPKGHEFIAMLHADL